MGSALLGCLWLVAEASSQMANSAYWAQPDWAEEIDSSEHGQFRGPKTTTCPCGWTNKADGRIVGGRETEVNEYPHMAGLAQKNSSGVNIYCGAAIVTPYHLITAAHCTENKEPTSIYAVVGDHNLQSASETAHTDIYQVRKVVQHEKYDGLNFYNDLALVILKKKMVFSEAVGPVCLPKGPRSMLDEYVKVTGWGNTKYKGQMSHVLLKVDLRVVPIEDCMDLYSYNYINITQTQFCTFGRGKDACQGDSGGPVIWLDPKTNRYVLVGVISFGWSCAKSFPGVNTDVRAFIDWINNNIKKNSPEKVNVCTRKD